MQTPVAGGLFGGAEPCCEAGDGDRGAGSGEQHPDHVFLSLAFLVQPQDLLSAATLLVLVAEKASARVARRDRDTRVREVVGSVGGVGDRRRGAQLAARA
ncbi:hypothetical protein QT969_20815 [Rhodococcus sp. CSLK01-03]|uniref:Uncharacterized protein n=1 Tax=Rhodococcus indonesiensis TaxID=3055869 RepID=A0ABT7RSW4_9NOCA|nr:hypothetical protein [Rhodococcus indonesiensis]MDM7490733.1 hypothetical protein [Rhodococcus indonesiensis]